jgi:hypothetical protein
MLTNSGHRAIWWPLDGEVVDLGTYDSARLGADGSRFVVASPGELEIARVDDGLKRTRLRVAVLQYGGVAPRFFGDSLVLDTYDGSDARSLIRVDLRDARTVWREPLERRCPHWIASVESAYQLLRGRGDLVYGLDAATGGLREYRVPSGPGRSGLTLGNKLITPMPRRPEQQKEWDIAIYELPDLRLVMRLPLAGTWPGCVMPVSGDLVLVAGNGAVEEVDVKIGTVTTLLRATEIGRACLVAKREFLVIPQRDEIVCYRLPDR